MGRSDKLFFLIFEFGDLLFLNFGHIFGVIDESSSEIDDFKVEFLIDDNILRF